MAEQTILIIDDDTELCELVGEYVGAEGFETLAEHDGERGMQMAVAGAASLVLLDVMLPGSNGFELLRRLRAESDIPVIMLTARGNDIDRIVGLEIGADDYLPKPFNPRELVARIRAVYRRSEAGLGRPPNRLLTVGDLTLDVGARTVRLEGEQVTVTAVEFDLLERLLRVAGTVVSRDRLARDVLDREYSVIDRSIDMHVSNLRKKLGPVLGETERIKTVRGVGYLYTNPSVPTTERPAPLLASG